MGRLANHIGLAQPARVNPVVQPGPGDTQMATEARQRPVVIDLVRQAIVMGPRDPVMLAADFEDGLRPDVVATGGAKPVVTQALGNLAIGVAL